MLLNDKKGSIFAPAKEDNSILLTSESSLKDQKNDSVYHNDIQTRTEPF